jgi:CheY-like chemotaxis protein
MPGSQQSVVLIVDDSPMITRVVGAVISAMGHQVIKATDGASALATAEILPPDLVFPDLHMPDMNGLQVLKWLRAVPGLEEVPVVLLTVSRSPEEVTPATKCGVRDYLSKPARPAKIREKVNKYLS